MLKRTALTASFLALVGLGHAPNTVAKTYEDFQRQMLLRPSGQQMSMEEKGRVVIYDGLYERDVALAMDTQFDRLDSMMFVRTQVELEPDVWVVADDGCD